MYISPIHGIVCMKPGSVQLVPADGHMAELWDVAVKVGHMKIGV
jgi:hypothetical protein